MEGVRQLKAAQFSVTSVGWGSEEIWFLGFSGVVCVGKITKFSSEQLWGAGVVSPKRVLLMWKGWAHNPIPSHCHKDSFSSSPHLF